ncbi:MAG: hypothetical protein KBF75_01660, partial [Saprospiraceae bacterium]|nr:hypothetical protein [Saprospiraceae bacterium]
QKCRSGWLACFVAEGQRALPFPFDPFFGAVGKAISVMILGLHLSSPTSLMFLKACARPDRFILNKVFLLLIYSYIRFNPHSA